MGKILWEKFKRRGKTENFDKRVNLGYSIAVLSPNNSELRVPGAIHDVTDDFENGQNQSYRLSVKQEPHNTIPKKLFDSDSKPIENSDFDHQLKRNYSKSPQRHSVGKENVEPMKNIQRPKVTLV